MSRKDPEGDVPHVTPLEKTGYIIQTRTYKLITPLFGGGAETQKADAITVVRGSEVRGHLRFWWRATLGGKFDGDLQKMKDAEEKIWGSSAETGKPGPSKVNINIKVLNRGVNDRPFEVVPNKNNKPTIRPRQGSAVPPYVAFPLQPEKKTALIGQETATVRVGVEFVLELSYPTEFEKEIQASLWAWETFGGIGGRTRRGFGTLQLMKSLVGGKEEAIALPEPKNVEAKLHKDLSNYVASGEWPENMPHLTHDLQFKIIQSSPTQAWAHLIEQYQNFRQKRHKRLGKSLWPEANEMRRRLGKPLNWPEEIDKPELVQKFPRAVFGLPILYHLPHDDDLSFTLQGKADPKTEKKFERLASTLILKPLPCSNGIAVGLAALLSAPVIPPNGLEIKEPMTNKDAVEWELNTEDANSVPLKDILHGQPDVLQAFLNFLK